MTDPLASSEPPPRRDPLRPDPLRAAARTLVLLAVWAVAGVLVLPLGPIPALAWMLVPVAGLTAAVPAVAAILPRWLVTVLPVAADAQAARERADRREVRAALVPALFAPGEPYAAWITGRDGGVQIAIYAVDLSYVQGRLDAVRRATGARTADAWEQEREGYPAVVLHLGA